MLEPLTLREQQVRNRLVQGYSNKDIGRSLGISHRTVEEHRRQVMRKMRVPNVVMLVRVVYNITDSKLEPEQC